MKPSKGHILKHFIADLRRRRDLAKYLVLSELKLSYANKVLGYFWSLLDPIALMAVYAILVAGIFKRGGPQFPILVFSSLLAWQWFSFSLSKSVTSLSSKSKIIQSISFPLIILPLSAVLTYMIRYLLGMAALIPMLFIYNANLTWNLLWFPVLSAIHCFFTMGICFIVAIAGVYFKDMQNIIRFVLRLWFYLSPVLYTVHEYVPQKFHAFLYLVNPFAALFTSYKAIFVWGTHPIKYIIFSSVISLLTFFAGLIFFYRYQNSIPKDL